MTVDEFCKWIERLEHPLYDIPRVLKKEKRYAFFNLAFGDFPGRAVGHFLKERGMPLALLCIKR